jgi:hypothetical protein
VSNPILARFWRSMGERFGKRWLDEYGPEPTRAWEEALRPWDADVVKGALEMMGEKGWQHPPTLPQFQSLLRDADRKHGKPAMDYVRGFWRTVIVDAASQSMGMTTQEFEPVLVRHQDELAGPLLWLLDEFDARDKTHGARTPEQVRWCEDRVRQTMAEFQRNRVAA